MPIEFEPDYGTFSKQDCEKVYKAYMNCQKLHSYTVKWAFFSLYKFNLFLENGSEVSHVKDRLHQLGFRNQFVICEKNRF